MQLGGLGLRVVSHLDAKQNKHCRWGWSLIPDKYFKTFHLTQKNALERCSTKTPTTQPHDRKTRYYTYSSKEILVLRWGQQEVAVEQTSYNMLLYNKSISTRAEQDVTVCPAESDQTWRRWTPAEQRKCYTGLESRLWWSEYQFMKLTGQPAYLNNIPDTVQQRKAYQYEALEPVQMLPWSLLFNTTVCSRPAAHVCLLCVSFPCWESVCLLLPIKHTRHAHVGTFLISRHRFHFKTIFVWLLTSLVAPQENGRHCESSEQKDGNPCKCCWCTYWLHH